MDDADRSPELRISDDERHAVAEQLRQAAGEGRIDLEELDERLAAAYGARTYADLVPLTQDLPSTSTPVVRRASSGSPVADPGPLRGIAVMSGFERKGVWTAPASMTVVCVMGGATLDFREARFAGPESVLTISAVMGGAEIVVGPEVEVIVEGVGIMGAFVGPSDKVGAELTADSPVLRVRGFAFWSGISVTRKPHRDDLPPGREPHRLH
ncbi:DUF1707 domain-containing protein [Nocardioides dongxiaopingii]|uniref:DUF1707 SHOCT-like domain-containing protein n=1 Tax=Nocardioides sp. S-1144 TaxID=2582905 RepID=UPI001161DC24|nr:DUF1707 domain-containing protein [Nocardioides sp. S-1144]QDH10751.1 DUF1707 domain-containing protein [Nocardioides sp. S-1144]